MVKYVDRCHCDHRMTTQGRITSLKGRLDPKRFAFEIQSELRWFATCICQQDPEGLFWMSFYHRCTQQEVMLPTSKVRRGGEKKKKANSLLTCDPRLKGAAMHAYRGGSNRVYDCIISPLPHHLSTHQWTLEATTPKQTDQASLIHSPPRCLCQVIAGGKRKTDQYISHGSDR